jgi:hypothetical protein
MFLKMEIEVAFLLIHASGAVISPRAIQLNHFLRFLMSIRVDDILLVILSGIGLSAIVSVHLETLGSGRVRRLCANRDSNREIGQVDKR